MPLTYFKAFNFSGLIKRQCVREEKQLYIQSKQKNLFFQGLFKGFLRTSYIVVLQDILTLPGKNAIGKNLINIFM